MLIFTTKIFYSMNIVCGYLILFCTGLPVVRLTEIINTELLIQFLCQRFTGFCLWFLPDTH